MTCVHWCCQVPLLLLPLLEGVLGLWGMTER
jgi:hypothetical protein